MPMTDQRLALGVGDRVEIGGGYSFEPVWLGAKPSVEGRIAAFIPGQNGPPDAVVELDQPITAYGITGKMLVLQLRYVGATWGASAVVHVELCDFVPEPKGYEDRQHGKWVESHATYKRAS